MMQTNMVVCEIAPGVQGLPCLHTPSQGKPCTPGSLNIRNPHRNNRIQPKYRFVMLQRFHVKLLTDVTHMSAKGCRPTAVISQHFHGNP